MDEDSSSSSSDPIFERLVGFIKPELEPGERLLWTAAASPLVGTRLPSGRKPLLSMLACWVLSVLVLCAGPWKAPGRWVEPVLAIIILGLLFGSVIAMLVSLDQRKAYQRRRDSVQGNFYAITDRRAIIWSPLTGTKALRIESFFARSLKGVDRREFPDGSGDILFQLNDDYSHDFDEFGRIEPGLRGVENVRSVEELIRKTLVRTGLTRTGSPAPPTPIPR